MSADETKNEPAASSSYPNLGELLLLFRDGKVGADQMTPEDLARVVEQLAFEGIALPEIAIMLKLPDSRVRTAFQTARSARAIGKGDVEKCRVAGDVWALATRGAERIRRTVQTDGLKGKDRITAEERAVTLIFDAVKLLQSLGAMPEADRFKGSTTAVPWWERG